MSYNEVEVFFPKRLLVRSKIANSTEDYSIELFEISSSEEIICFKRERPKFPLSINLMITNRCSTDCAYCYADRSINDELSTQDVLSIIRESRNNGTVNLTLTGGDLLMRQDSLEIFKACIKAQFNPFISTKTPKSANYVKKLKEIGITEIQFSLDSVIPSTLKRLLNVSDSYIKKVGDFFSACRNEKIRLSIRSVLTNLNATTNEISTLYSFLQKYENIEKWTITPAFHSEYKTNSINLRPDNDALKAVYFFTQKLNSGFPIFYNKLNNKGYSYTQYTDIESYIKYSSTCLGNTSSLSILCDGSCTVCEMLYGNKQFELGNIKEKSLYEIWNSEKAFAIFRGEILENSTSPCASCKSISKCKGDIFKRVCYVDVIKVHGKNNGDQPDPKCPKCIQYDMIL